MTSARPLDGIRVLAVEQMLSLPYATQLLGFLGADVVKVEPLDGDGARASRPQLKAGTHEIGAVFVRGAAGKRSIAIDLKSARGKELLLGLIPHYDVVAENMRAGAFARLGFDFDSLVAAKPDVVLATISGYGQLGDSPYRHWPAFGPLVEAMSGLNMIGRDRGEDPIALGSYGALGDIVAGIFATLGVLAAIRLRDLTGQPQHSDTAMLDASMVLMDAAPLIAASGLSQHTVTGAGSGLGETFAAKDGRLSVFVIREYMFARLAECIGHPEWVSDPAFARREQWADRLESDIRPAIESWASDKDKYAAADELARAGVAVSVVHDADDLLENEHVRLRNMLVEVADRASGNTWPVVGNPVKLASVDDTRQFQLPDLGEHTSDVLASELGLDPAEIQALVEAGVIA